MRAFSCLLAFVLIVFLSACATQPLYYWGHYEDVVYKRLAKQGNDGPPKHIELLRKDLSYAQEKGLDLPPGFHAHLAMLYSEVGNHRLSKSHLTQEKTNFPESATFMQLFLKTKKGRK